VPLSSLSSSARRPAVLALLPLVVGTAALVTVAPTAQAVDISSPVVISEVYGGGGNSGATLTHDFIELYNNSDQAVDLSTWSVQYAGTGGTATWQQTNLAGFIDPRTTYLVQEARGGGGTTALPPPDATGTIPMGGTGGRVALVKNQTLLVCGTVCASTAPVVDFVGYGAAPDFAGSGATTAPTNSTSVQRFPEAFTNTGNNAADFTVAAPTPKAPPVPPPPPPVDCATTPTPPECVPGTTTIQDIQGSGFLSPLDDQLVERVPGIVTAVRSNGFWIQQPDRDASRPAASSGVFVFTSIKAAVSDSVVVTGTVQDFYDLSDMTTTATTSSLSVTEISATVVTVVSKGNALPPPLVISSTTVPGRYVPPLPQGATNVESITTVDPSRSTLEFWEAHEGMLVTVNEVRVVGPGQTQFREIYVTTKPDELRTPRGGTYLGSYEETPTGRVLIIPASGPVPAANVGDLLSGATTGPVDWSRFGGYTIAATTLGTYVDNHLAPTSATKQADDQLAVATYNVENLAPSDPGSKYARLAAGIVGNLQTPDIVAVEEIQDNTGSVDDGTVVADQTLTKLAEAIKVLGPEYRWAVIDPVNNRDGGQPGGNIRSAFLYNPKRVTLVPKELGGGSTDAVAVLKGSDGTATLSLNPGRVDPANVAWNASRKPLAGEFVFQGRRVIVVANHFNSKGGDQSADGRFQPPIRSSETQRELQAAVLNQFVDDILAVDANANVVLAGDFNDYQFSKSMETLTESGKVLRDLITTLPENEQYTYVFNGVSQVLDHIFVTKPVTDVEYQVLHLNAEFANQVSDHDPQVVRIRPTIRQGTLALDPSTVSVGATTTVRLAGWYANRTFTVSLDGTITLGTVTTDAAGSGSLSVPVTATTGLGPHTVTATSATDGATASAQLTVTVTLGTVVLSPPKVKAGKQVRVELVGWSLGVTLSVLLDGTTPLGTVTTTASGSAEQKVLIPAATAAGMHQLVVRAADGEQVTAALEVSR
jgi:predicted extracellular nuclease